MTVVLKGEGTIANPSNRVRRTFHFPSSFGLTLPAQQKVFFGGGEGECGRQQAGAIRKAARKTNLSLPFLHFPPDFWRSFTPLPIETASY